MAMKKKMNMAEEMAKAVKEAVSEGKGTDEIMQLIRYWNKKISEQEGGDECHSK